MRQPVLPHPSSHLLSAFCHCRPQGLPFCKRDFVPRCFRLRLVSALACANEVPHKHLLLAQPVGQALAVRQADPVVAPPAVNHGKPDGSDKPKFQSTKFEPQVGCQEVLLAKGRVIMIAEDLVVSSVDKVHHEQRCTAFSPLLAIATVWTSNADR